MPADPKASRPHMPGYGIADAGGGKGLLPWNWASERLVKAHNYFVSTTRPDGVPHTMPVWGVWLDQSFYFSTSRQSRKARNLAANPKCVVCPERGDEAVILEGVVEEVTDPALFLRFTEAYYAKYQWKVEPSQDPVYAVRPQVAFGFIETGGQFTATATRWIFESG